MKTQVFKSFEEYWSYAKFFTVHQRDILLSNLPSEQRQKLMRSYQDGGWEDLVVRNELDGVLDVIKEDIDVDLLQVRCSILLKRKKIKLDKAKWDYVQDVFGRYKKNHIQYIFGGITAEKINNNTILLVKEY